MFYRQHKRVTLDTGNKLITKQSHKDECDIHRILKQYQRTGIITHVQAARPTYTDLPSHIDLQESLNTIMQADEAFNALPSKVRDHFNNDPMTFLFAFQDEAQAEALRGFGLLRATPPAAAPSEPPSPPQTSQ